MAVRVSADQFDNEVIQSEKTVVADFYSDSCVPCKRLSPVIAEIEEEHPEIKAVKVNINFDSELAEKYGVMTVPTVIIFKNGAESERIHGTIKKSDIEAMI